MQLTYKILSNSRLLVKPHSHLLVETNFVSYRKLISFLSVNRRAMNHLKLMATILTNWTFEVLDTGFLHTAVSWREK